MEGTNQMSDETIKCPLRTEDVEGDWAPVQNIIVQSDGRDLSDAQRGEVCRRANAYSDLRAQLEQIVELIGEQKEREYLSPYRQKLMDAANASRKLLKGLK
jgi:hypothetical protein